MSYRDGWWYQESQEGRNNEVYLSVNKEFAKKVRKVKRGKRVFPALAGLVVGALGMYAAIWQNPALLDIYPVGEASERESIVTRPKIEEKSSSIIHDEPFKIENFEIVSIEHTTANLAFDFSAGKAMRRDAEGFIKIAVKVEYLDEHENIAITPGFTIEVKNDGRYSYSAHLSEAQSPTAEDIVSVTFYNWREEGQLVSLEL